MTGPSDAGDGPRPSCGYTRPTPGHGGSPPGRVARGYTRPPSGQRTTGDGRPRYAWQVFGLVGGPGHPGVPTGRRFPGGFPVRMTAVVPTDRCGAVPESHRIPSRHSDPPLRTSGKASTPPAPPGRTGVNHEQGDHNPSRRFTATAVPVGVSRPGGSDRRNAAATVRTAPRRTPPRRRAGRRAIPVRAVTARARSAPPAEVVVLAIQAERGLPLPAPDATVPALAPAGPAVCFAAAAGVVVRDRRS